MAFSYRTIDGGLHIVDACPADIGPTMVWPVEVPDGRTIVVGTGDRGISRYDLLSGEAYPPTADEKACTIWAVTTATLPGGRVMVADAGYDGRDRGRPALGRGDRRPGRGTAPGARRRCP